MNGPRGQSIFLYLVPRDLCYDRERFEREDPMAEQKKNKSEPKKKNVKVMSPKDCKDTKGGLRVSGGLAGPEDFGAFQP